MRMKRQTETMELTLLANGFSKFETVDRSQRTSHDVSEVIGMVGTGRDGTGCSQNANDLSSEATMHAPASSS